MVQIHDSSMRLTSRVWSCRNKGELLRSQELQNLNVVENRIGSKVRAPELRDSSIHNWQSPEAHASHLTVLRTTAPRDGELVQKGA